MKNRAFATGVVGTVVSLICCFTPVVVLVLGALGLAASIAWLDYIVLPALIFFVLLTIYGAVSSKRKVSNDKE